jgi:hypothetical protein
MVDPQGLTRRFDAFLTELRKKNHPTRYTSGWISAK